MLNLMQVFQRFYYLMKLHYSQTITLCVKYIERFYYLMKLHYSQTSLKVSLILSSFTTLWNYTILKLLAPLLERTSVLLPYEITLFSNRQRYSRLSIVVLLPYEITLFSNPTGNNIIHITVLLPYEITLFSNVSP